eukprot:359623-Chlamydomonas_euryale.AAC.2
MEPSYPDTNRLASRQALPAGKQESEHVKLCPKPYQARRRSLTGRAGLFILDVPPNGRGPLPVVPSALRDPSRDRRRKRDPSCDRRATTAESATRPRPRQGPSAPRPRPGMAGLFLAPLHAYEASQDSTRAAIV